LQSNWQLPHADRQQTVVRNQPVRLLNKLEYLQMLGNAPQVLSPSVGSSEQAAKHVGQIWSSLKLDKRELTSSDVDRTLANGPRQLFYFRAWRDQLPTAFVIVVTNEGRVEGHILLDLAAEHASAIMDCPSFDFLGKVSDAEIQSMIPRIAADDDNPFAVLTLVEGTYMQTLRTEAGYSLEYQLVNTSSHYQVSSPLTSQQVVTAMISFGFGGSQWLTSLDWQLQSLDC
jgi:hypothetical protein